MDTLKRGTFVLFAVAGLRWAEFLISPVPLDGLWRPIAALVAALPYLLAAVLLAVLTGVWWLVRRLFGQPTPADHRQARARPPLTGPERARAFGRDLSLWWMFGGVVVLIMLTDTGAGPFAWAVERLLGHANALLAFLLACVAFLAPMLLLGMLPRHTRWPVLAGAQDIFKPQSSARRARPRPPRRRDAG